MFASLWDDVKREFSKGNTVTRLIIVNVSFFVLINLFKLFSRLGDPTGGLSLYNKVLDWFMISSDPIEVLTEPWTLFTSMFLHEGFWHILWNMLFLYWFGRIVGDLIGDRHILPMYLLGGLVGNIAFLASAALMGYSGSALGASGAVMAIVLASAVLAPDYMMYLLLIGPVKLKYIVAVLLFLDLIGIADDINTGGHFAHLGGAFMGWLFVLQLRSGTDLSQPVNKIVFAIRDFFRKIGGSLKGKPKGPHLAYRNKKKKKRWGSRKPHAVSDVDTDGNMSHQEELDAILDKIKKTGYESLTAEEKEFLFKASKK
ncbi:MAG: rhomboid family intramembrane serine protease [Bacteroidota bacterium]